MSQKIISSPSPAPLDDPLIRMLAKSIRYTVRILAVMMVLVIWWGVADVAYVLYERVSNHPYYLLNISDLFATFGAFMAVARKVIVLDYKEVSANHVFATAALLLALAVAYWLAVVKNTSVESHGIRIQGKSASSL